MSKVKHPYALYCESGIGNSLIALSVLRDVSPNTQVVLCGPLAPEIGQITGLKQNFDSIGPPLIPVANLTLKRLLWTFFKSGRLFRGIEAAFFSILSRILEQKCFGNYMYREFRLFLLFLMPGKVYGDTGYEVLNQEGVVAGEHFDFIFPGASKIAKAMKPCFLEEIKFSEMVVFEGDYNLIENDAVKIYSPSDFDFEKLKQKKILCCDTSLAHILYWQSIECDVVVYYRGTSDRQPLPPSKNFHYKTDYCKGENCFKFSRGDYKAKCKTCHEHD